MEWRSFEAVVLTARVLIVHVPERAFEDMARKLVQLGKEYPLRPVVLLTSRSPEGLRHLLMSDARVADLVWTDAVNEDLWDALGRAKRRGLLGRIASLIEQADVTPSSLRNALADAVRSPSPPRRVADLAALAHCDRTTLWKQWRAAFGPQCPLRPSDFVGWLLITHAVARKRVGRPWALVADELGVHEDTLARLAKRHAGLRLRQCDGSGYGAITQQFKARVLQPLLRSGNKLWGDGNDVR